LRSQVALEIKIVNPADVEVVFAVQFHDDELIGEKEIKIPAHEEKMYQLIYAPSKLRWSDIKCLVKKSVSTL
jgi:hypothetical protein